MGIEQYRYQLIDSKVCRRHRPSSAVLSIVFQVQSWR
ncbi:Uncharacterised protein [Vibrio cholerae]|nr:Uncharacterised protein [Vibrio cholerae]